LLLREHAQGITSIESSDSASTLITAKLP